VEADSAGAPRVFAHTRVEPRTCYFGLSLLKFAF
jgi:hypothetical protein